jgi:hypothetical protein
MDFYASYNDMPRTNTQPTSGDYAWAEARTNAAPADRKAEVWEKGLTKGEHIVVLQGQVSFLAGFVKQLLERTECWCSVDDLKTLDKIEEWGKE